MKYINKLWALVAIMFVTSCSLTELDLLDSPNSVTPDNAQAELYFNAIQLDVEDFNNSVTGVTSRLTRQLAMTGGNTYENGFSANSYNFMWNEAYANLLPDLDQLIAITESPDSKIPGYSGAAKVIKAHVLMTLVDMFGDVPYSEAGQGVNNPSPKADSQVDLYNTALELLNGAITDFGSEGLDMGTDLFYNGDLAKWTKLANTLKIKWYLNVGSGNSSFGTEIAAAAENAITAAGDDWQFSYSTNRENPDARHPWYTDGYETGPAIYLSNYYMWLLKEANDPRLPYYFYRQDLTPVAEIDAFTLDCGKQNAPLHYDGFPFCHLGDGYWGRDHGNNDGIPPDGDRRTVAGVYPAGGLFDCGQGAPVQNSGADGVKGAGIQPMMLSSFTHFMLAEAALTRGTGGDAAALLEEGVKQSIAKVMSFDTDTCSLMPTMADVDSYVSGVMTAFNAADAAGKLQIVMQQYYIASWGNGIEMYDGYRRTTYPSGLQPTLEVDSGTFPRLNYYPADYLNLNANISAQRALSEQVFWDTNPAGAIN